MALLIPLALEELTFLYLWLSLSTFRYQYFQILTHRSPRKVRHHRRTSLNSLTGLIYSLFPYKLCDTIKQGQHQRVNPYVLRKCLFDVSYDFTTCHPEKTLALLHRLIELVARGETAWED